MLVPGASAALSATYPAVRITAALRRRGVDAALSRDAGDYVCNAALYRSLLAAAAPRIGFVHVPRTRRADRPRMAGTRRRPTIEALTGAVLAAILVMAGVDRQAGNRHHASTCAR